MRDDLFNNSHQVVLPVALRRMRYWIDHARIHAHKAGQPCSAHERAISALSMLVGILQDRSIEGYVGEATNSVPEVVG